jgi:hypothetical protein
MQGVIHTSGLDTLGRPPHPKTWHDGQNRWLCCSNRSQNSFGCCECGPTWHTAPGWKAPCKTAADEEQQLAPAIDTAKAFPRVRRDVEPPPPEEKQFKFAAETRRLSGAAGKRAELLRSSALLQEAAALGVGEI